MQEHKENTLESLFEKVAGVSLKNMCQRLLLKGYRKQLLRDVVSTASNIYDKFFLRN